MKNLSLICVLILAMGLISKGTLAQETSPTVGSASAPIEPVYPIAIGTGGYYGIYFQLGGIICRFIKEYALSDPRGCKYTTGGSVSNIFDLRRGDLEFVIVQSDWQERAYTGSAVAEFQNGPYDKMRKVFSLHKEIYSVFVRKDSPFRTFDDLKNKRLNIGDFGSGQRETTELILQHMGLWFNDFASVHEYNVVEQAKAICEGKVDAISFVIGHPNLAFKAALQECDLRQIPLDIKILQELVDQYDYFSFDRLPLELYDIDGGVELGLSVGSGLVTHDEMDAALVYRLVKSIFENFEKFKRMHPALVNLTRESMLVEDVAVPFHDGALRYYQEMGWK